MDGETLPALPGDEGGLPRPVDIFSDNPDKFSFISVNFLLTSFLNLRAEELFGIGDFSSPRPLGVVLGDSFDGIFSASR